jgi:hypothetical protein
MARSRTSFRPGQSGNPRGRPRGAWGWKRRLREHAQAELEARAQAIALAPAPIAAETEGRAYTVEDAIMIVELALAGDVATIRRIIDEIEDDW